MTREFTNLNIYGPNKLNALPGSSPIGYNDYLNGFKNTEQDTIKQNTFGGALKSLNNLGNWGAMTGNIVSDFGQIIGDWTGANYGDSFTDSQKATQSGLRSALAMIPGYGQIIAAATGALDAIGSATGTNLSNVNKDSASRLGLGGAATTNNIINHVPGLSALSSGFGLLSERTDGYRLSDEAEVMQSGYSGTLRDLRATEDIAGKRIFGGKGWGAASRANGIINSARRNDQILSQINETNTMHKQSNYYQDLTRQNINRYAGENYLGLRVGKNGMKLMSVDEVKAIIAKKKDAQKLQNGGVVGIDSNILPEGALHARKNNLSELNPDLEDATKKGIPVMAAEGGEVGEQVAEIEHSEIIFRLEVTKRLEELRNDGSEEAMIEAGKLIAEELIENTQDNTGQITEEVENGK